VTPEITFDNNYLKMFDPIELDSGLGPSKLTQIFCGSELLPVKGCPIGPGSEGEGPEDGVD
jgi:hypothetical protein